MGLKGAGIATFISVLVGGIMVVMYVTRLAEKLRLIRIKTTITSLAPKYSQHRLPVQDRHIGLAWRGHHGHGDAYG